MRDFFFRKHNDFVELTLIIEHKELKGKKDADKLKCVIYWKEIKGFLFLSDGTIKDYIDTYRDGETKKLFQTNYKGRHFKLSLDQNKVLSNYIEKYNVLSSKQAVRYIKNKLGISFTRNGMTKTLIRLGFSYKKAKRALAKWDSCLEACFKSGYYQKSEYLSQDESIYFMDGAGFVHNTKIGCGWIRRGKNKAIKTNTGRKKLNMNGAYDIKNHKVISICQEENVNTESNIRLIKKVIGLNPDKSGITIILDNAKMNKNEAVFDFVKKQNKVKNKIELMYTPPYSPHLNLIERLWRFLKKKLLANQFYSSYIKFRKAIEGFLERRIQKFKGELKTLMTENFQKVCPWRTSNLNEFKYIRI